jgi:hypothetical protein
VIDTIQIAKKLESTGLSQQQSEAIAQSMLQIPDWANLATKLDLKADLAALKAELIYWIVGAAVAQFLASFLRH